MIQEHRDKYVYLHLDKDGIIRYVGHGNKERTEKTGKKSRSAAWAAIFSDYAPTVEIVASNLSYREAIALETELIEKYSDTIVNVNKPTLAHDLDYDLLNEWFYVDSTSPSGLRWKKQRPRSKMYAGDQAGSILTKETGKKYWQIKLCDKVYKVHRIVYILHHGKIDQDLVIDHIDGDGLNNNIDNLRLVTQFVNSLNMSVSCNKQFPVKWVKETRRCFYATFEIKGGIYNFRTRKDEHESRDAALQYIVELVESSRDKLLKDLGIDLSTFKEDCFVTK